MSELKGKTVWITGGGSGIGLAAAIDLAKGGAWVVISDRDEDALVRAVAQIKRWGGVEAIPLDVTDQNLVANTAKDVETRHGRIDILLNCAGINVPQRSFKSMSVDTWDRIMAVNISGMFYCCHAVIPGMRANEGGLIINISSRAARYPSSRMGPAYNTSKRAVIALTESINIEESTHGIRATAILPGAVSTPLLDKRPNPPSVEDRRKMLQPEDLGRVIHFIATLPATACVNELMVSPTWQLPLAQ